MTEQELQLSRDLEAEARRIDVDVDALWREVSARTAGEPMPAAPEARLGRRLLVPLFAGVAAAAVIAAIVIPLAKDGSDRDPSSVSPDSGPVDGPIGDWACPHQAQIRPIDPRIDPTKVPSEAADYGVPRYHYEMKESSGTLEYGDSQGNLIASTKLSLEGSRWKAQSRTVCSGPGTLPSPDPERLGRYTGRPMPFPHDSDQVQEVPSEGEPVVLDDRTYYDEVGMLRHSTLYAYPTARGVQLVTSPPNNNSLIMGSYRNEEFGTNLIDGSGLVGPDGPSFDFRGWQQGEVFAYFSVGDDDVVGLSTALKSDGTAGTEQAFEVAGGTLYTVKAAVGHDGDQLVTLTRADGTEETVRY